MNRRGFLIQGGASVTIGLSGCLQDGPVRGTGESDEGPEDTNAFQFQYDARNTGVSPSKAPETTRVRWKSTVSPIEGGLSVANGRVVVPAGDELVALDADEGTKLWETRIGMDIPAPSILTAETAYVTTRNGPPQQGRGVVAIDLEDGSERWRTIPTVDISSAPKLANGTIYVSGSSDSEEVIALDASGGEVQWRFEAGDSATTPAIAEGTVYVGGGSEGIVYALDAETGDEVWQFTTHDRVVAAPTVTDDTVYIGSRDERLYAVNPDDGTERWHVRVGSEIDRSVAANNNSVYVPARDSVVALDSDGNTRWSIDTMKGRYMPTIAGDKIVTASGQHAVCLDSSDGHQVWQFEVEKRPIADVAYSSIGCEPVVADEDVYVASSGGHVYALQSEE